MTIKEQLYTYNEKAIFLHGYDSAIVGIYERKVLVYNINAIIDILCKNMTIEEAIDFFYFNIESPICDHYPIFIETEL